MNIESFAVFYVNYLEPMLHFLGFLIIGVIILALLNIVRDGKKKGELVNSALSFIIKILTGSVTMLGRFLLWLTKASLKIITVIYASFRDFFTSKI